LFQEVELSNGKLKKKVWIKFLLLRVLIGVSRDAPCV